MNNIIDKIKINDLHDLMRIILKVKTVEFNVNLSEAHINLLLDFYFNGIISSTYTNHILKSEKNKNYFKSKATIDNAKTYFKKNKLLIKNSAGDLVISPHFLPLIKDEDILLNINVLYLYDK